MDFFGIGNAIKGAALIYFQSSRKTGRTASLVQSLKNGDRVVCSTGEYSRYLEHRLKSAGKFVEIVTCPPSFDAAHEKLINMSTPTGRLLFDHTWVEQVYLSSIDQTTKNIDHFQREFGGWGEAHEETRLKAMERIRWPTR